MNQKGKLIQGTEVTSDANRENEDPKEKTDKKPEIVKHCDDDTEDILEEKIIAGGTSD